MPHAWNLKSEFLSSKTFTNSFPNGKKGGKVFIYIILFSNSSNHLGNFNMRLPSNRHVGVKSSRNEAVSPVADTFLFFASPSKLPTLTAKTQNLTILQNSTIANSPQVIITWIKTLTFTWFNIWLNLVLHKWWCSNTNVPFRSSKTLVINRGVYILS